MWDEHDPEVQEIAAEQGRQYVNGGWRGWTDRSGRWNPRMHVPAHEQERLDRLVMERKLQKQQQREAELARQLEQQAARAEAEEAVAPEAGGTGRRLGMTPFTRASVPGHVAGMVTSVLGAGVGLATSGMALALSPLGATGTGITQIGRAVADLLAGSIRMISSMGSGVLTVAIGTLFAGAIGAASIIVLDAVSDMFGRVAQAITTTMQGVATVIRDTFRDATEYARNAMQMVYVGGYGVGESLGAIATFGAFGLSPAQTAGLFGSWTMRPEFLEARLAPLGGLRRAATGEIDWPATLRAMRSALSSYPEMAQYPMLQALLGAQGANLLMPLMQMEEGAFEEALGASRNLTPQVERVRALREELMPLQGQVALLAQTLKLELASAALEPVLTLLRAMVGLVRENRDAITGWLRQLPERLADWLARAAEYAERFADSLPEIGRRLGEIADHLRSLWDWLRRLGDFVSAHPTLSAVLAGAGIGALRGGVPGAVVGGLVAGGAQVGTSFFGGWGGVGGGLLGLLGGVGLMRGLPALATRMAAPELLAFPLGLPLAEGAAGLSGLLGFGLSALPYMAAIAAGVLIPYYASGYAGARAQAAAGEEAYSSRLRALLQAGVATPHTAAASLGPDVLAYYEEHGMSGPIGERIRARLAEMRGAVEGRDAISGFLRDLQERMRQIADNTSPDRVQEAMRRGQAEAQREAQLTVVIRPSTEFEAELERQEALRAWRGIQLAVG